MREINWQALQSCLKGGVALGALAALIGTGGSAHAAPPALWVDQIGSSNYDDASDVATDSHDDVIAVGTTYGSLVPGRSGRDAWVAKYDAVGHQQWIKQFGATGSGNNAFDFATGVTADKSDNIFVGGYTSSNFFGSNKGGNDAFVAKFRPSGSLLWTRSIGTSARSEQANALATDAAGNVILCGYTTGQIGQRKFGPETDFDAWLAKYNATGTLQWVRQLGTSQYEYCNGVATDKNNNIILAGTTYGPLGGPDPQNTGFAPWIAKYNPSGGLTWVHQVVTIGKQVTGDGVATDKNGNVLVGGTSNGRVVPGPYQGFDAWVGKYTSAGSKVWISEYGTSRSDSGNGVTADAQGNVLLTGRVAHDPFSSANPYDVFVRKYSPAGAVISTRLLDGGDSDVGNAITTDSVGDVYVAGTTEGDLDGPNQGRTDAFLAKLPK